MRAVDLILEKRRGGVLDRKEIEFLVGGFTRGEIPDYQMSAFLMAVCFKGMTEEETVSLTRAMIQSGETLDLAGIKGPKVDKHSTGGVGDKTSLVLGPLLAAAGLTVSKMSGRGLGHTGGTLDKLESLEGFRVSLSAREFVEVVNAHGLAIISQTGNLVPADKQLYVLRDVTGTVDSVPLIAASIMSKKLAVANDALVLDVKTGSGAFMKTLDDSRKLAHTMVRIGQAMGRKVRAVITDMDQPLGRLVGNSLEVQEAMDTLRGQGPADLCEVVLALATQLLVMTGKAAGEREARATLEELLSSGKAFAKFTKFVEAQGGKPGSWDRLPVAKDRAKVGSPRAGVLAGVDCEAVGRAAMKLGAGRETKDASIDLSVGLAVCKRVGDRVAAGEPLFELYHAGGRGVDGAREELLRAVTIGSAAVAARPLVHEVIQD